MGKLTRKQAAVIGTFMGTLCGPFADIQKLGDELTGSSTWTHQYENPEFAAQLKELVRPQFLALCATK
jgi:hypothetical protein